MSAAESPAFPPYCPTCASLRGVAPTLAARPEPAALDPARLSTLVHLAQAMALPTAEERTPILLRGWASFERVPALLGVA